MLATARTTQPAQRSGEVPSALSLTQRCPYCCDLIPREAKKCRSCGEWVVRTSSGVFATMLRLAAFGWAAGTLLVAAGLLKVAEGVRRWVWLHAVDPTITPKVVDVVIYLLIALVVIRGLMVSVGLGVMAGLSPRRPRGWS
jgi:uncharacterized membrane protein